MGFFISETTEIPNCKGVQLANIYISCEGSYHLLKRETDWLISYTLFVRQHKESQSISQVRCSIKCDAFPNDIFSLIYQDMEKPFQGLTIIRD
jgi:hypothetical protein